MGTDDLFKKRREARKKGDLKRKEGGRVSSPRILVCCEGEQTEVLYFKSFRIATLVVKGYGMNTVSLVDEALKEKQTAARSNPFDQVWCVFDKDSFSTQQFHAALQKAAEHGIRAAYSNEAFELWFVLHFDFLNSGISREQYREILTKKLRRKYSKNDPKLYAMLLDLQPQAIQNASKLMKSYRTHDPARNNPSTTVHELVLELNKYLT